MFLVMRSLPSGLKVVWEQRPWSGLSSRATSRPVTSLSRAAPLSSLPDQQLAVRRELGQRPVPLHPRLPFSISGVLFPVAHPPEPALLPRAGQEPLAVRREQGQARGVAGRAAF